MCGIVAAVSNRNIVPILVQGLQRLEYRGYDSCGVAVYADGLKRARSTSRVAELQAQVSAEQAARLGQDLTPLGAEKAGNAAGSIPAWDGGLAPRSDAFDPVAGYKDPFAADQPLFSISHANAAQYSQQASAITNMPCSMGAAMLVPRVLTEAPWCKVFHHCTEK